MRPFLRAHVAPEYARAAVTIVAALVSLASAGTARAQEPAPTEKIGRGIILGSRGGPVGESQSGTVLQDKETGLEFSARAGFATDYIYRGVTLSDRRFALGAGFEAAFDKLYAGITVASVKLPTQPSSEVSFAAGIRPKIGNVEFDLAWTYYAYPKESVLGPTGGTDYWEASLRAETKITEALRIAGGFAYSPNVSNTGATGQYVAVGLGLDLPGRMLPKDISASLSGSVGYSRFGNMEDILGGYPLPAYANWNAGVTFAYKILNFDLRYYDTNLSRENCYIYTGDTNAVAGGIADPLRNPDGLMSRWCGAAFVGKVFFALN
jgi:uncharacterized protein (TIGR02001 family)